MVFYWLSISVVMIIIINVSFYSLLAKTRHQADRYDCIRSKIPIYSNIVIFILDRMPITIETG